MNYQPRVLCREATRRLNISVTYGAYMQEALSMLAKRGLMFPEQNILTRRSHHEKAKRWSTFSFPSCSRCSDQKRYLDQRFPNTAQAPGQAVDGVAHQHRLTLRPGHDEITKHAGIDSRNSSGADGAAVGHRRSSLRRAAQVSSEFKPSWVDCAASGT